MGDAFFISPPLKREVGGKAARRDFFGEIYNLRKNFTRIPPALRATSLFKGGFLHSGSLEKGARRVCLVLSWQPRLTEGFCVI